MTHDYPVAGVGRRLAAMAYDAFLIFALLFIASLIPALLLNMGQLSASPETDAVIHELDSPLQGWVYRLYLVAVVTAFYTIFWRKSGQTLGMQAWRIKLESLDGNAPTLLQCLRRALVSLFSIATLGLGYWWIWLGGRQACWHDMASGTRVIVLPKNVKKTK